MDITAPKLPGTILNLYYRNETIQIILYEIIWMNYQNLKQDRYYTGNFSEKNNDFGQGLTYHF